ncbi:sensor histidine kinase [Halovenus rubra]|uniref:Sensor histidine kinase n=2 Tax=Halovenus rubra TaxID=869890 RepID=A0ACC7E4W3_9EURY|nr:HAMP domain-containing sensor histidine kinase [Halovenus rubra]
MSSGFWVGLAFFLGVLASLGSLFVRNRYQPEPALKTAAALPPSLTAMDDPVALQRTDGTIAASNTKFDTLVGTDPEGKTVSAVLSDTPELKKHATTDLDGVAAVDSSDGVRYFDVSITETASPTDGRVLFFHEVSQQQQRLEELEVEIERLDRFASLISHDIRNPLDVAIGRTNAVVETSDDEDLKPHLDSIQGALERMQAIIADGLMVARKRDDIGDTDPTSLDEMSRQAWENVDTKDATINIEPDVVIEANSGGLSHVLENLFRNAIEHVGPDVSVTVGSFEDGFYIEDDGEGIPAEKYEAEFDPVDGDCGLGLTIVHILAQSHGWSLTITEGQDGGARFEFSNVSICHDEVAA